MRTKTFLLTIALWSGVIANAQLKKINTLNGVYYYSSASQYNLLELENGSSIMMSNKSPSKVNVVYVTLKLIGNKAQSQLCDLVFIAERTKDLVSREDLDHIVATINDNLVNRRFPLWSGLFVMYHPDANYLLDRVIPVSAGNLRSIAISAFGPSRTLRVISSKKVIAVRS